MTAGCDKCGRVKRDVRVADGPDGLSMLCGGCAPRGGDAAPEDEEG